MFPVFQQTQVDFGAVIHFKFPLLRKAFERFHGNSDPSTRRPFQEFCQAARRLARRLCAVHGGQRGSWRKRLEPMGSFDCAAADRSIASLDRRSWLVKSNAGSSGSFCSFKQWMALKQYCHEAQTFRSWEISRSLSPAIAQMSGRILSYFTSMNVATQPSWRVFHRIISARLASFGAIRSIAGTSWRLRDTTGGCSGFAPHSNWLTWCASTISAGFEAYWEVPGSRNDGDPWSVGERARG